MNMSPRPLQDIIAEAERAKAHNLHELARALIAQARRLHPDGLSDPAIVRRLAEFSWTP